MATKEFGGDIAYQWEMWIGRDELGDGTYEWTQIFGFSDLPWPQQVPEDQDATHMQSPGRTRETIPGLLPVADWSSDKQLWGDEGDTLLETLAKKTADGDREIVLIEFNDIPEGGDFRRTYRGYINSFTPTGTVGDIAQVTLDIKILDRQDSNERTINGGGD